MKKRTWAGTLCVLTVALAGCGGSTSNGAQGTVPAGGGEGASTEISGTVQSGAVTGDRTHYQSVVEMIRGHAPGVQIVESQGGSLEVRVRGVNQSFGGFVNEQPLVVLDGVPQSRPAGDVLLALNPEDVSRIEVLRDVSSTSIYGTRGANGVIVVQTKRRN